MAVADDSGMMAAKKSDLALRTAAALVMILVAGAAIWAGGLVWQVFVVLVALGVLWEWVRLVIAFKLKLPWQLLWFAGGLIYIGFAAKILIDLREQGLHTALGVVMGVIAIDIGAYFAGRLIGGPKIAPRISPSKTWAGLGGAILAICLLMTVLVTVDYVNAFGTWPWASGGGRYGMHAWLSHVGQGCLIGVVLAIVAQSGDFFESWMKRRARVKDSGMLLPGHGGLFDRVDGLLAVLVLVGIRRLAAQYYGGA